jgi:tRNA threonylcarbamoyladenosine biosynthesis protein TsaB
MIDRPAVLSIDTALQGCSAAVLDCAGHVFYRTESMGRGQSERLVPMIEQVMAKAGLSYKDLSLIAVTIGPGAFTGLRIGLSAARAFGASLGIPVLGVTTFEPLARMYREQAMGRFAVVLETKRSDFYTQIFTPDGAPEGEMAASSGVDLAARLHAGDSVLGDGAERFLKDFGVGEFILADHNQNYLLPDPVIIGQLGAEQFKSGHGRPPAPLYLRDADVSTTKMRLRSIAE